MQPIQNIAMPAQPLAGGMMPAMGQPETAGFDFMSYLLGLQVSPTDPSALMPEAPATAAKPVKDGSKDPLAALFTQIPTALPNPSSDPTRIVAESMASQATAQASGSRNAKPALPQMDSAAIDSSMAAASKKDAKPETDPATGLRLEGFRRVEGEQAVEVNLSKMSPAQAAKKYAASGPTVEKAAVSDPLPSEVEPSVRAPLAPPVPIETKRPAESGRSASEAFRLDGFTQVTATSSTSVDAPAAASAASSASGPSPVAVPEVVQRVESLVQKGGGEMTVSLDPPDLGKLEIKVTARGNRVEVEMRSESAKAKSALESHLGDLKSAMQSHDLQLTKMEVQVHHDPRAFQHSFAGMPDGRHAGGTQGERQQNQPRSFPEADRRASAVAVAPSTRSHPLAAGDGRIDRVV